MTSLDDLKRIAEVEFADIVKSCITMDFKIRFILFDDSFIDIHLSQRLPQKFGYHWECRDQACTFYRYDNFPDKKWQTVATYPLHFHVKTYESVEASPFPATINDGFRSFMEFVRGKIQQ